MISKKLYQNEIEMFNYFLNNKNVLVLDIENVLVAKVELSLENV